MSLQPVGGAVPALRPPVRGSLADVSSVPPVGGAVPALCPPVRGSLADVSSVPPVGGAVPALRPPVRGSLLLMCPLCRLLEERSRHYARLFEGLSC